MSDNVFAEFLETLKKLDVDLKESQIKVVNGTMNVICLLYTSRCV